MYDLCFVRNIDWFQYNEVDCYFMMRVINSIKLSFILNSLDIEFV